VLGVLICLRFLQIALQIPLNTTLVSCLVRKPKASLQVLKRLHRPLLDLRKRFPFLGVKVLGVSSCSLRISTPLFSNQFLGCRLLTIAFLTLSYAFLSK
jgi:hypothetical protein